MLAFQNPWLLWGLLGLALPVLIHLLDRQLHRPLRFPSTRFILRGRLPVQKRRRLRDLLLLLARMALFTFILLALARPEWRPPAPPAGAEGEGTTVYLVDLSGSMSGWNGYEEAVRTVRRLLEEDAAAEVGLVLSADRPVRLIPPVTDRAEVLRVLEANAPRPVASRHDAGFREAFAFLAASEAGPRRLEVISDFSEGDWPPGMLPAPPAGVEVRWRRVGVERSENVGLTAARVVPAGEDRRRVLAEVRNFGTEPATRQLALRAGSIALSREIELAAGATHRAEFVLEAEGAGPARLELSPADAHPDDDRLYFWAGEPAPLQVLGLSAGPASSEALFFLRQAFAARAPGGGPAFVFQIVEGGNLPDLFGVQAIFVTEGGADLPSATWEALDGFVEDGGRLILGPGEAPARLAAHLSGTGRLPVDYRGLQRRTARQARLASPDAIAPDSALARVFAGEAASSLFLVNLHRYARFEPADPDVRVLLRADDGVALLLEAPAGRGSRFLFAFGLGTADSDLPLGPAFLPLVRELAAGDVSDDIGIYSFDTGFDLAELQARLGLADGDAFLFRIDPAEPGVFLAGMQPVEVNFPRSQSPTGFASTEALTAALPGSGAPGGGVRGPTVAGMPPPTPLWHWAALAAVLFFLLEIPLGSAVSKRRPQPAVSETS
ncbi:MAG: VWA domain-containing protein [Puniceicoccaceae bacterium]|nr:MAG: VWA domain-containing protein [Puniceicoccaceae bacterium]